MTEKQKTKAWDLFIAGGDNRDSVIAKKLGVTHSSVCVYLSQRLKIIIDRVNSK